MSLRISSLLALLLVVGCSNPPGAPPTVKIAATPSVIVHGGSSRLEWAVADADSCQLGPDLGTVTATGSLDVKPESSTTYILVCSNKSGSSRVETTVAVSDPVTLVSFTSDPSTVNPGETSDLRWAVTNATSCSMDHGIGAVNARDGRTVTPDATTTYTLTCEGAGGPITQTATVNVRVAPSAPTLQVTPGDGTLRFTVTADPGTSTDLFLAAASGVTKDNYAQKPQGEVIHNVPGTITVGALTNGTTYYAVAVSSKDGLSGPTSSEVNGSPAAATPAPDPFFVDQWHLVNTGQAGGLAGEDIDVAPVWSANPPLKGEGVRVVVVDEGVELTHEDLIQNIATGQSHDYLDPGTQPEYDGHATSVAGLIAARDLNGLGVRGVAPRATLVSFNLLQNSTSENEADAMTRDDQLLSVSNNSWGDADDGTGLLNLPDPLWAAAVDQGVTEGRNGLGTIYVWAAGNGGDSNHVDDSNYDGQANYRSVFAIGALNDNGTKCGYSEEGANLLVSAHAGDRNNHLITTTDRMGGAGYNPYDPTDYSNLNYTNTFDGTSSATPVVVGVVALILQANPALTWRDVRLILAKSARKNVPTDSDWTTNGAGLHVNHKFGFGAVDAAAAVALAKTWTKVSAEKVFSIPEQSPALTIPDNAGAVSTQFTVSNSGIGHIEFVEIQTTIDHARSGDLEIVLTNNTTGTRSVLANTHSCAHDGTGAEACSDIAAFTFGSLRHLDEAADGTWTLSLQDKRPTVTGTLQKVKLTFRGRQ